MKKILMTIAVVALLVSCKKDEVPTPQAPPQQTSTAIHTIRYKTYWYANPGTRHCMIRQLDSTSSGYHVTTSQPLNIPVDTTVYVTNNTLIYEFYNMDPNYIPGDLPFMTSGLQIQIWVDGVLQYDDGNITWRDERYTKSTNAVTIF